MQTGLLMETAQTHQKLAEASLQRLDARMRGLDTVARAAIRDALVEELRAVHDEARRAQIALRAVQRAANWKVVLLGGVLAAMTMGGACGVLRWLLPTPQEVGALRATVAELERRGGRIDIRTCGDKRLCARIDSKAPRYGEKGDYLVIRER